MAKVVIEVDDVEGFVIVVDALKHVSNGIDTDIGLKAKVEKMLGFIKYSNNVVKKIKKEKKNV